MLANVSPFLAYFAIQAGPCESFQMSRKGGGRITGGHIEWKARKRRTYWIDQRVPTTLLPYFNHEQRKLDPKERQL